MLTCLRFLEYSRGNLNVINTYSIQYVTPKNYNFKQHTPTTITIYKELRQQICYNKI